MTAKEIEYNRFMVTRQKVIRKARRDFWTFCRVQAPRFFREDRWHLKLKARLLQALYERRLTKEAFEAMCADICPAWFLLTDGYREMVDRLQPGRVYTRIMTNEPPRTGKSRTLTNFTMWCLGVNVENKIITCSYADDMAQDFSRHTRDGIMQTKTYPHETIYNDIFPGSVVQDGHASYKQWALEGQFFNYKGAGIGGQVTGKGCNISLVDDPVKDASEALNETRLEVIYTWYSGTFLSRMEEEDGVSGIEIVNMTRWASKDICGRILGDADNPGPDAHNWFVFKLEAMYKVEGEAYMLCPSLLSKERYERLKANVVPEIFYANYHQENVDTKGRLYKEFKTYKELPKDDQGNKLTERVISYTDTADDGSDYLCTVVAEEYQKQLYVIDVQYTKEGMENTEPEAAAMLTRNRVSYALLESNNGGKGFARQVQRLLWDTHRNRFTQVKWFHQSKNKRARIISTSNYIQQNMYFPVNWRERWPEYYKAMTTYQKEGKNAHDDAPDATTGLAEMIETKVNVGAVNI